MTSAHILSANARICFGNVFYQKTTCGFPQYLTFFKLRTPENKSFSLDLANEN